ncbi:MAG: SAM-dependent chlorinase/fluorinase [Planctomycetes bacterium]|nr:SAM-dependent chlorinase/fluorinase [Planctomycetota bacterium]
MPPIVLLTDFGEAGPYVGAMKGVILGIHPKATLVDLSHEIPPQDVRAAAFVLDAAHAWFPPRSLFVCVVDPGVGTARRIVYVEAGGRRFLAPDNGLLTLVLRERRAVRARAVTNRRLFLPEVSSTFHGRDVFAPVAARLARGLPPASLGPPARLLTTFGFPEPERDGSRIRAKVVWVDSFGNVVLNLRDEPVCEIRARRSRIRRLVSTYGELLEGEAGILRGSSGWLEIAVRNGSAASRFGLAAGDEIDARLAPAAPRKKGGRR